MRALAAVLWLVAASPDRAALDRMFAELRVAPNEQVAGALETAIERVWARAGSAAVHLLIARGDRDFSAGNTDEAIADFSDAITLDPTLPEAWHRRALVRARAGDDQGAIGDVRAVLAQEPRHFVALRTLSTLAELRHDYVGALAAWNKVLEIDPQTPGGAARKAELERRAYGQPL